VLGFEPLTSQILVVKHMTVRVRGKLPALIPALEQSPTEGAAPSVISRSEAPPVEPIRPNGHTQQHKHKIFALL
jgi:hypothetical protein